jgi:8-amino-7-oxononanoate synthase
MPSLDEVAREYLLEAEKQSLTRRVTETDRLGSARVRRGGREFVSFSCNDYLGLAHHPRVIAAARAALERYGAGAGASRLVTGSHPLCVELEHRLAELKGSAGGLVFGSGYLANLGVISALVGPGDLILVDRYAHASMWDGARLSGADVQRFAHNSADDCRAILRDRRGRFARCLILTETVFSMDGDLGPVEELAELGRLHDCWLMSDDAHGLGMCSSPAADLQIGTLSKAIGAYGGYVCASAAVIAFLVQKVRSFMFSTALPPATVASALEALRIIREDGDLVKRPLENARRFTAALARPPATSAIVPVIVGSAERALAASAMLADHGFLVVPIRPPSVPAGTARLRFAFSAMHQPEDIERAAALLREHGDA